MSNALRPDLFDSDTQNLMNQPSSVPFMHERQEALEKLLDSWLEKSLNPGAFSTLTEMFQSVEESAEEWEIFLHFSSIHRHVERERLSSSHASIREAERWIDGWQPARWDLDEVARARLLLSLSNRGEDFFFKILDKLFESSDMREAETLCRSLPVLPWPEKLASRAAEGIRSNITSVYLAVAHHNPYPVTWLDDNAWNQMILKALFIEVPLYRIWGLDSRRNEELYRMVIDLAHERWAAGRSVSPEMWRLVTPWITDDQMDELTRLLESDDSLNRIALQKLCMESANPLIKNILKKHPERFDSLENPMSWNEIGKYLETRGSSAYNAGK